MHRKLDPAMAIASVVSSTWDLDDAPLCIVPWSFVKDEEHYNQLINRSGNDDRNHARIRQAGIDKFTVLAQAGDIIVRDVRCPHMGTPHWSTAGPRAMFGIIAYRRTAVLMDPSLYCPLEPRDLESKSEMKVFDLDEKSVWEEHCNQRERYGNVWTYRSRSLGSQPRLDRGSSLGDVEEVDEAEAAVVRLER
jgi:hypothetical protein